MSQESGRPSEQDRYNTNRKTFPSLLTTHFGEFESPVDGSEERENDGSVGDLNVFDRVEEGQCVIECFLVCPCSSVPPHLGMDEGDIPCAAIEASRARPMVATEVPR